MNAGSQIRAYETMRGWWVTTVRVLSFVLVLALVVPGPVHSAEAHRSPIHELSISANVDVFASDHANGCQACHANCSCHLALSTDETPAMRFPGPARASYATETIPVGLVSPDRLPRPPRA